MYMLVYDMLCVTTPIPSLLLPTGFQTAAGLSRARWPLRTVPEA